MAPTNSPQNGNQEAQAATSGYQPRPAPVRRYDVANIVELPSNDTGNPDPGEQSQYPNGGPFVPPRRKPAPPKHGGGGYSDVEKGKKQKRWHKIPCGLGPVPFCLIIFGITWIIAGGIVGGVVGMIMSSKLKNWYAIKIKSAVAFVALGSKLIIPSG